MEARLNIVTLGVRDLDKAIRFYRDGLGWPMSSVSAGDFAIFKLSTGTALALFPRELLALDANVRDPGGFGGITLAHNVATREEVDLVLSQAIQSGGSILKPAQAPEWGGYSGYFADPDGHPWEIAWNPHFELEQGADCRDCQAHRRPRVGPDSAPHGEGNRDHPARYPLVQGQPRAVRAPYP